MSKKVIFEDALKRLNEIVSDLENGEIALDDMTRLYEEGSDLIKICLAKLDDVEKKISTLSGDQTGILSVEALDE